MTFVEGGLIRTLEFSTDGEPLRNWSTPIPDELNSNFILLATDVISDGSIIFAGSYGNGYPYTGSTYSDVFAARINMGSGAAEFQRFAGPNPDYLYYLTATRNGEVYIGGFTNLGPTSNRETQYVRQVW